MCTEKNDRNEKTSKTGSCCEQMAEMMKKWCPDSGDNPDCFTAMQKMMERMGGNGFCGPQDKPCC